MASCPSVVGRLEAFLLASCPSKKGLTEASPLVADFLEAYPFEMDLKTAFP